MAVQSGRMEAVDAEAEAALRGRRAPELLQPGDELGSGSRRWQIQGSIGGGGFGQIYLALGLESEEEVGVKVEPILSDRDCSLYMEARVLRDCQPFHHFPRFHAVGTVPDAPVPYAYLVMELLSVNLSEIRRMLKSGRFSGNSLRRVGVQCVDALRHLHTCGYLHRDVKPSNWSIGIRPYASRVVKLIDFGLARHWRREDGRPKEARPEPGFRGTARYASLSAHEGRDLGRLDDLASLFYMLLELGSGGLPWRRERDKDAIARVKAATDLPGLLRLLPAQDPGTREAFRRFAGHLGPLQALDFGRQPPYARLAAALQTSPHRLFDWEVPANLRRSALG